MTHLERLTHAQQLMFAVNKAHNSTYGIFMDVHFKVADLTIEFDVLGCNLIHAAQLCELLNLTLHIEANSDPTSDKQLNFYIN